MASARYPQQKEMAERCGADLVVGSEPGELEAAAQSLTNGLGADVTVETVGGNSIAPLETACGAARSQGTVIVVGGFRGILPVHGLECPTVPKVLVVDSLSNSAHACDGHANALEKCDGIDAVIAGKVGLDR